MANAELVKYIKTQLKAGYPQEQIRQFVIKQKYSLKDIEESFVKAGVAPVKKVEVPEGYFYRLKEVLTSPREILEQLKDEEGMKKPLKFFFISYLIYFVIGVFEGFLRGIESVTLIITLSLALVGSVAYIFAFLGLVHLGVKLMKGKHPFYQTFKAFAYIVAYDIVVGVVRLIAVFSPSIAYFNIIIAIWAIILFFSAMKQYTELSSLRLAFAIFLSFIILIIIGTVIVFSYWSLGVNDLPLGIEGFVTAVF